MHSNIYSSEEKLTKKPSWLKLSLSLLLQLFLPFALNLKVSKYISRGQDNQLFHGYQKYTRDLMVKTDEGDAMFMRGFIS